MLTRRSLLITSAALSIPWPLRATPRTLTARSARVNVVGAPYPDTDVWCFDDSVPGPILRVKQGERLQVTVKNELAEETTVHWHGIRLPNAMDGVPYLTQQPI